MLEGARAKLSKQIEKLNPKISKTCEDDIISGVLDSQTFFGCKNGTIGTIEEIKSEAQLYIQKNSDLRKTIAEHPEQFAVACKKGHAVDFFTHLQHQGHPFPIKEYDEDSSIVVDVKMKREAEQSEQRAKGLLCLCHYFTMSLCASMHILALYADTDGQLNVLKAVGGEEYSKLARILPRAGTGCVRYARSLLIAYTEWIMKRQSMTELPPAFQFLFSSFIRYKEPVHFHIMLNLMCAEIIVAIDPKKESDVGQLVMLGGVDAAQYSASNTLVQYYDTFATKSYDEGSFVQKGLDLGFLESHDVDMIESNESKAFRAKVARLNFPTTYAQVMEMDREKLLNRERAEEKEEDEFFDPQDPMGGVKASLFGGFADMFKLNPPKPENKPSKDLNNPPPVGGKGSVAEKDTAAKEEDKEWWYDADEYYHYDEKTGKCEKWEDTETPAAPAPAADVEKEFEKWEKENEKRKKGGGVLGDSDSAAPSSATVNSENVKEFMETGEAHKYELAYDKKQFIPFMYWLAVLVDWCHALNPRLYRVIRYFITLRMFERVGEEAPAKEEEKPPHELLWAVWLKSSISVYKTRAAETKPELVLQDLSILAQNGLLERSVFTQHAEAAAAKNFKMPTKAELQWPAGFLQKDRVLATFKLLCER
eukprot:g3949.t1